MDPINGNRIEYCIKSTDHPANLGKTLYAFHGMGGSANEMCDKLTADTQAFETHGSIFHVICPSFGPYWVIHEAGLKESFARFRSVVEQQYSMSADQKSVLYGESMGGFNVLKVSGSTDSDSIQFQKAVAACPAVFSQRLPTRVLGSLLPASVFGEFDRDTSISIIQDSPYFDVTNRHPELLIMPNQDDFIGCARFQVLGMSVVTLGGIYQGAVDFHRELLKRGQVSKIQVLPILCNKNVKSYDRHKQGSYYCIFLSLLDTRSYSC